MTDQDISLFIDTADSLKATGTMEPHREMHWPKLALGDRYPVTDRDGRILRHAQIVRGNEDLL